MRTGDRVKFISDTVVGIVKRIDGGTVWVETEDGFDIPAEMTQLVVVNKEDELEALARIGESDERPGRKKSGANTAKKEEKKIQTDKIPSYRRYGKVTLVDRSLEEGETEEEEIDLDRIREQYLRNMVAVQQREQQLEQQQQRQQEMQQRVIEESAQAEQTPQSEVPAATVDPAVAKELAQKLKLETPIKPKKATPGIEVVDLHAQEIVESTQGMAPGEILSLQLARFTLALDTHIGAGRKDKMVFIHGVGKGKLRYEMEKILRNHYPKLRYQDASFQEYGYGAVLIFF